MEAGVIGGGGGVGRAQTHRTAVIWSTRRVLTVFEMVIKSHTGETVKWVSVRLGMGLVQLAGSNCSDYAMGVRMRIINLDYSLSQLI